MPDGSSAGQQIRQTRSPRPPPTPKSTRLALLSDGDPPVIGTVEDTLHHLLKLATSIDPDEAHEQLRPTAGDCQIRAPLI